MKNTKKRIRNRVYKKAIIAKKVLLYKINS